MMSFYEDIKASVNFKIEHPFTRKSKSGLMTNFNMFERTTDIIKFIHQQASEKYDEQLESLHKCYNIL